ncbi:2-amino-4-hydroxy-6-hydroxymethyldihydropteridine diphosphokinase [Phaeocystidibacter marisrubri]|uniref:2-amino-4-hydroxy-6-hydroxymethyldihydropteridine pyrophosphokinase n=1 Tax=Phaeocystidibacter marisrubri TaxID=1577780 RepID=A0A6L3ZED7_9FLAO|nr:2-amino-4-hydroxy-6-hydroxymethyldihydropteridine diphosphokinase [Phaeocystidibacter marisrubri]KAB2816040.1 2-amino-4-hydroxy-6-hydroxymethyldihydropteridine diphosphokinase [Phaeocystidibacter marisrubri]GGH67031.1 2-amino-4-hydroxy-6-hydroxymethyldihydropteridine diphosphokinase [Phaeocystidibacter marisrubri]
MSTASVKNSPVLILLGGNQGDVRSNGTYVREELDREFGVVASSHWYSSPAWGFEGAPFLNAVLELNPVRDVHALLSFCLEIERELGRVRSGQGYSDRPMDVDILYVGQNVMKSDTLEIPHPRIAERRFTLVPLCEKWGEFHHPVLGLTQNQLLKDCQDSSKVERAEA